MKETIVKRKKFVPYEKSSKKERKDRDKLKRNEWDFPPITKVIPDKRKKKTRRDDYYYYDDDYND